MTQRLSSFAIRPCRQGNIGAIVRLVVKRAFFGLIQFSRFWIVALSVDPNFEWVPYYYFVAAIAGQVHDRHAHVRMTVVGKGKDPASPTVVHSAILDIR